MKKATLVYFLVPLLLLGFFCPIYYNFDRNYEHELQAKADAAEAARVAKIKEQNRLTQKAYDEAQAILKQRKAEKDAKDAELAKYKQDMYNAEQARDKAAGDVSRFTSHSAELARDISTTQDAIDKIKEDERELRQDYDGLREVVVKTEANTQSLNNVLNQISAADAALAAKAAADKKS